MEMTRDGDTLVLKINLSQEVLNSAPQSASGKTVIPFTTGGFMMVPQFSHHGKPLKISLNVTATPR